MHINQKNCAINVLLIVFLVFALSFSLPTEARTINVRAKNQTGPMVRLHFKKGEKILVSWKNNWYLAKILKTKRKRYYIHYVGWDKMYDEWVTMGRMAKNCGNVDFKEKRSRYPKEKPRNRRKKSHDVFDDINEQGSGNVDFPGY